MLSTLVASHEGQQHKQGGEGGTIATRNLTQITEVRSHSDCGKQGRRESAVKEEEGALMQKMVALIVPTHQTGDRYDVSRALTLGGEIYGVSQKYGFRAAGSMQRKNAYFSRRGEEGDWLDAGSQPNGGFTI